MIIPARVAIARRAARRLLDDVDIDRARARARNA